VCLVQPAGYVRCGLLMERLIYAYSISGSKDANGTQSQKGKGGEFERERDHCAVM
jgi:hypothetical protein